MHLVSVSENEIYQVEASGRQWALRVQRPGYQSRASLLSEMAWLVALREEGVVATPVPIAGLDGQWVQSVSSPATGKQRNAVLFLWEQGSEPTIEKDLPGCLRSLGATAAQMHLHSQTWVRPETFERGSWNFATTLGDQPRWGSWRDGLGMHASRLDLFAHTVELIRGRLQQYGDGPDCFGLVHGDLRTANLLLHQGQLKVIDFDDCGFSWFMYDLAAVVSFYEHRPELPALLQRLLDGYRTVRAITSADEAEIPSFVMLRRLLLVAWIGSHAETALARSLGATYTEQTDALCRAYLKQMG